MPKKEFSLEEAERTAEIIGIKWDEADYDLVQFRNGMNVELEHGARDPQTNITDDDPVMTGKIALAHLKEFGNYYILLEEMEEKGERDKKSLP